MALTRREVLWRVGLTGGGVALGASLAGAAALHLMRRLYLERADLRLDPAGQAQFAEANRTLPAIGKPRTVFFGDSRVEQWSPPAELPQRDLLFRGISGQTTAQMRLRFAADVLALSPKELVVQAGINDLIAGAILQRRAEARRRTLDSLVALAAAAHDHGIAVLLTTIVRPAAPGLTQRLLFSSEEVRADVAEVNAGLRALSSPDVQVIDADTLLAGSSPVLPAEFAADAVHLNAAAYARLNDEIEQAIGP